VTEIRTGEVPAHSAANGPFASPGYWLHHAALAWRRELGDRLRPLEITPTQFDVLASLSWQSRTGQVTQQMIADFAGIDRMMTSKVMRVLEDRGLVTRTQHSTDARALALLLTAEGRAVVTAATAEARALDRALFGSTTDSEPLRGELAHLLDRLRDGDA
jgi:DNA-binding MarR family transcriptional regulator